MLCGRPQNARLPAPLPIDLIRSGSGLRASLNASTPRVPTAPRPRRTCSTLIVFQRRHRLSDSEPEVRAAMDPWTVRTHAGGGAARNRIGLHCIALHWMGREGDGMGGWVEEYRDRSGPGLKNTGVLVSVGRAGGSDGRCAELYRRSLGIKRAAPPEYALQGAAPSDLRARLECCSESD